ncbi:MAG: DUF1439 domain-containing protein [Sulfuriferula sp.]
MKWFKLVLILILAGLLASCNTDPFKPTQVTFTQSQLQTAVAKKFPVEKHYLEMADLIVSNPVVSLRPDTNRIAIQFDAEITMLGASQPLYGEITFSSGLIFDSSKKAVVLKDPLLEQQKFVGLSSAASQVLSQLAAIVIKENLDGRSVHTCKPGDLEFLGRPLTPTNIQVTQQGVVIHLAG